MKRNDTMMDFIRKTRKGKELTQKDIAIGAGISPYAYGKLERGNKELYYKDAVKILRVLGLGLAIVSLDTD